MAQTKKEERITRKLQRVGRGRTYSITIPIEIIRSFGWKEKQKLVFEADKRRNVIKIRDWE
ncbi:MAG: hypothetical protein U9O20_00430 [Patescibacteria group bacterium]|nr:hypothetical protein [Patescibacteria group bacterium]